VLKVATNKKEAQVEAEVKYENNYGKNLLNYITRILTALKSFFNTCIASNKVVNNLYMCNRTN